MTAKGLATYVSKISDQKYKSVYSVDFPQLEESLQHEAAQPAGKYEGPKTEMILSFV